MLWGNFARETRIEEKKRFISPTFNPYHKPCDKVVTKKEKDGPCYVISKCNDCPLEKVTVKRCKRCRVNKD